MPASISTPSLPVPSRSFATLAWHKRLRFKAPPIATILEVLTLRAVAAASAVLPRAPFAGNQPAGSGFIALGAFFIFERWV